MSEIKIEEKKFSMHPKLEAGGQPECLLIILFVPLTCNRKDTGIAWSRGCRLRCKSRGRKAIGRTLEPVPKQNCPEAKKSFVIFQIHLQPSSQLSEDLAKTGLSADCCFVESVIELVQGIFKPFPHILFESLIAKCIFSL